MQNEDDEKKKCENRENKKQNATNSFTKTRKKIVFKLLNTKIDLFIWVFFSILMIFFSVSCVSDDKIADFINIQMFWKRAKKNPNCSAVLEFFLSLIRVFFSS